MKLGNYKQIPTIAALMQPFPYFAEPDTPVTEILRIMNEHDIRHLPIKQSDRIIGIVSERDLHWVANSKLVSIVNHDIPVAHVMTYNPYQVDINTPLTKVIFEMTQQKIGAAIVTSSDRLAGIVTTIDIAQALGELLESQFNYY
ncbi:putative chloride channel protein [Chondrocystis sp. NIES-4102]|nr:putative chloride channel protein [Chondrocystis sp. NIES-4102]